MMHLKTRLCVLGMTAVATAVTVEVVVNVLSLITAAPRSVVLADKRQKATETRPPNLDLARERPMEGAESLTATVAFPRGEPRLQRPFDVIFCLKPDSPETLKTLANIDMKVTMPEHAHGMMVVPERQKPRGACVVYKGLRLHMAGWWRLDFRSEGAKVSFHVDMPAS